VRRRRRKPQETHGAAHLRQLHSDPDFASARDERGRERSQARCEEMQRLGNAACRGYDVPADREAECKMLKAKRSFSSGEIGAMLGLKRWRRPAKNSRGFHRHHLAKS
jgi:hypothetical protein